jgi:osmotically-inducible protein OsmY
MGDLELRHDILEQLDLEPGLDAAHLAVAVEDGVVTLSGHVTSLRERQALQRILESLPGVRAIAGHVAVRPAGDHRLPDAEIARRAAAVLAWCGAVPQGRVAVAVQEARVTLTGEVDWRYQSCAAERAVAGLAGVAEIDNRLSVRPAVRPGDVAARIHRALHREADLQAGAIHVVVEGSRVILEGRVRHLCERRSAERAAWAVPGVTEVIDRLTVI